jgi:signal transduction histidine kinase
MDLLKKISGIIRLRKSLVVDKRTGEYEQLKEKVKYLQQVLDEKTDSVDRAKSIFLKNLYHEIRTPLNAIVGFSELIEMNSIKMQEKEAYITQIRESSRDFLHKMDTIIEASVIEAGLVKLSDDECNIYDLLTEIHTYYSIQKHINEQKIAFLLTVQNELKELYIRCDSYRLTQVLSNLLSNSFKFTNQGIIEFGCKSKGENIEFFVKDSGIGGLEGKEELLFKSFSKMDESDASKEGLGLGLSLSKKLVELMQGKIWYESILSRGTIFYFTIPFVQVTKKRLIPRSSEQDYKFNLRRTLRRSVVL